MTLTSRSVVIGTAGHVDHGKTALLRALTGIDADRLPEEKRRGITIDLGFAFLDALSPAGRPLRISFVDVPGHSSFIHNMLAGAGSIAAVMLVISAEEGIKPQTVEHLQICELLGIRTGITVITKMDAVDDARLAEVERDVRQFLSGTFLGRNDPGIVTVSATTGQNLDALRGELTRLAEAVPDADLDHLPRLPIDRAFVVKGFGTVVTGTLLAGELLSGQQLTVEPGGRSVRVRGLEIHGHAADAVRGGSRAALNLQGIEQAEAGRGHTLVLPGTLSALSTIDVEARLLPGIATLKHGSLVHFHAFTSRTVARVLLYGPGRWEAGSGRLLRLKLQNPVLMTAGDAFVLRQVSPAITIGGGRVLDANPLPRLRRRETLQWLEQLRNASTEQQIFARAARRGTKGIHFEQLAAETGLGRQKLIQLVQPLIAGQHLLAPSENTLVDRLAVEAAGEALHAALREHPGGLKRSELRSRIGLSQEIFDFLVDQQARATRLRLQGEIVLPRGAPSRNSGSDPALAALAAIYREAGLLAPLISEVAATLKRQQNEVRALVTLLLREKVLVPMGSENLFIHQEALACLCSQISELRGQTLDVARFKQITSVSRKYAIPLLEYLDRQRVTRRQGDQRLIL